ncbi:MAG: hypothetical protein AAFN43_04285, partial [Pseudomonadota bacterium]
MTLVLRNLLILITCLAAYGSSLTEGLAKQRVLLQARLAAEGPVLRDGVEWRIFEVDATSTEDLKELVYSFGGSKAFDIEPGEYYVHAAYGHAAAVRKINVS